MKPMNVVMDVSPAVQFEVAMEILVELKYLASLVPLAELADILTAFSQDGACATRPRRDQLASEFSRLRELSLVYTGPRPDRDSVALELYTIDELMQRACVEEAKAARARLVATRASVEEGCRESDTLLTEIARGEFRRPKASLLSLEGDRAADRAADRLAAASPTPASGGPGGTTAAALVIGLGALALWGLAFCGGPAR